MTAKSIALVLAVAVSAAAGAQSWSRAYDSGLTAARAGKWAEAREAFQQAIAGRTDDRSAPTVLPGPATERKLWRDGAPYSPNFLAAYSIYRQSLSTTDALESSRQMRTAAGELETLISKDQLSPESFFFLDVIYSKLGDTTKRNAVSDRLSKLKKKPDFKVDDEIVAPEELAAMNARYSTGGQTVTGLPQTGNNTDIAPIVRPGAPDGGNNVAAGAVVPIATKFALVIGQSQSRISGGLIPYGAVDAERVHDALITYAGYPAENVVVLQNTTAAEIKTAAAALASRIPQDGTVVIYYAGAGVNLAGKDYLAGVDTESAGDTASMVAKSDLFGTFAQRGARIFAFFESNRPIDANGFYFGREVPTIGSIAQMQSTRPGDDIGSTYRDNKEVGLFTSAFVQTLSELRVNHVPIFEFSWQVFYAMRRGASGTTGGGGKQVCTLPQFRHLADDAKF